MFTPQCGATAPSPADQGHGTGPVRFGSQGRDAVGYHLGVDLGTTFVSAALCRGRRPEMVALGVRSVEVPAVVFLGEDGALTCGEAARQQAITSPARVVSGFKRRLGDPTPVRIGRETRSATELLAALLRDVVADVTAAEGGAPDRLVLTHPANWGALRQANFVEVARQAGLPDALTVSEPVAAAVHYACRQDLADARVLAVYDLGGGTFDATVLRTGPGQLEVLGAPEGIERLGGIDFDEALYAHIDHRCDGALSSVDRHDPEVALALARVRRDCVLVKERLSKDPHAVVPVLLPDRGFEVRVSRAEFEELIGVHVESTVGALERTLRSAHLTATDLDAVLLVGGSSRIPLVADMLRDELGCPLVTESHPKYAVALGAAALAQSADSLAGPIFPVLPSGTSAPSANAHPGTIEPGETVADSAVDRTSGRESARLGRLAAAVTIVLALVGAGGWLAREEPHATATIVSEAPSWPGWIPPGLEPCADLAASMTSCGPTRTPPIRASRAPSVVPVRATPAVRPPIRTIAPAPVRPVEPDERAQPREDKAQDKSERDERKRKRADRRET